jgi:hypothetical protein
MIKVTGGGPGPTGLNGALSNSSNPRHQTNVSMRSNVSGVSYSSNFTSGGTRRDKAPTKA